MTTTHTDQLEQGIRTALNTIIRHWTASLNGPRPGPPVGARPVPASRPPLSAPVIDDRLQCTQRLASWALVVAEDRGLHTDLDAGDTLALARLLETHANWLSAHEAAGDARAELEDSAAKIKTLATGAVTRRFRVGECPEHGTTDMGERVPCDGALIVTFRTDDELLPPSIRCTTAPAEHRWAPREWEGLGKSMQHRQEAS